MYLYTFDKKDYKEEVKQFEKIMQLVNLGNVINFNNANITVTYIDMRSVINNGKYYQLLTTWYKIFEYQNIEELMLSNVTTFQKLANHLKHSINVYIKYQYDKRVYKIVKYDCLEKFL